MALPYPGMSFTPFNPLPSTDLGKMVANIEALAVGTAISALDLSVTALSNPYAFLAYNNAVQNLTSSAQKISFNTEVFDTHNNFASSRYTAPITGFYRFYARAYIQAVTGTAMIYLYKNGALLLRDEKYSNGGDLTPSIEIEIPLTATDYVEVYVENTQGTRNWYGASGDYSTSFGGRLVSKT